MSNAGVPPNYPSAYDMISREVNSLVEDQSILVFPKYVALRNSEEELINKYFEVRQDNECFEVLDSDEEASLQAQQIKNDSTVAEVDLTVEYPNQEQNGKQLSLLKPLGQRVVNNGNEQSTDSLPKQEKYSRNTSPLSSISDEKSSVESLSNGSSENNSKDNIVAKVPVTNIRMSRMNLRQALKKARTENLAALQRTPKDAPSTSAAALAAAAPPPPAAPAPAPAPVAVKQGTKKSTSASNTNSSTTVHSATNTKKSESRKSTRGAATASTKATDIQTSSDDSNLERERTPPKSSLFDEPKQTETMPEDVGQESFLKIFGLFTFEYRAQMQQRRSKRKRRCVHNNERSDFLYGRFEVNNSASSVEEKKKRQPSWLSPQPKKRTKRRSADKQDDINSSRSNSSSPNDKRACNECLKGGGCLDQCAECQLYYHDSCHHEDDIEKILPDKDSYEIDNIKRCPRCKRAMSEELEKGVEFVNLRQKFQLKAEQELNRRYSLEKVSTEFKSQMRELFNIVNVVRTHKI
ncbi:uncharacterized protein LOC119669804 isoform X2 [Teleopsis dalmanni]|nr:uncharacterized protein LOC119669804 isoform X2 [Teleopsis dalmanni]